MLRSFVLGLGCLSAAGAVAQVWCPSGATWYYTDSSFIGGTPGYRVLQYVQDTTIGGQPAQQLSNTWYRLIAGVLDPLNSFKFHTYQAGDVVYCKTELSQPWDTLYWFGAVPGDHWHFAGFTDSDPCDRLLVTDTGHVTVGGLSLRYLDYEQDSAGVWVVRRITERFGDDYTFWPQPQCGLNEVKRGLRCYADDDLGLVSTGIVPACDYTNSIGERAGAAAWSVSPNPAPDGFVFQGTTGNHRAQVFDATGHLVADLTLVSGSRVDATAWPAGTYVLRLVDEGVDLRWVKE